MRPSGRIRPRLLAPVLLALLAPLLLGGCWTLDHFIARVRIEADGSYKYFAEGTAAHTIATAAFRRADYDASAGKAKAEDIQKMRAEAKAQLAKDLEAAGKDKRVQVVQPIEGGRVRFMVSGTGSINGGAVVYMERDVPLSYSQAPGGALRVTFKDAVVSREAESLGLKVTGDLAVTLAPGIEVLEHNAEKAAKRPGDAYRWHIEKPGESAPYLLLRLPKP